MKRKRQMWEVIEGGLLTTVQDLGRPGYYAMGVSPSGAFDAFSLKVGNLLLRNELGEAGLEVLLPGLRMKALSEMAIAITGGDLSPTLNGQPVQMWRVIGVHRGDILHLSQLKTGCRAYIAISGGIDVPLVFGSKSTLLHGKLGGYEGRSLKKGDLVNLGRKGASPSELEGRKAAPPLVRQFGKTFQINVVRGLEDFLFTPESIEIFFSAEWKVSPKANRLGVRYRGPRLSFKPRSQAVDHEAGSDPSNILDDLIPTGGIQVPAGLEPTILCVDGPSTGGYAKIGTVISSSISWIGQSKPGDSTFFKEVSLDEAYRILKEEAALFHEGLVLT
jgi:biotin-dependent carboxylase-like uncharacterized protein